MKSLLVLGLGYVGRALIKKSEAQYSVVSASRGDQAKIHFDLNDIETWANLPSVDFTIWTFPAEPPEQVAKFLKSCGNKLGRIVVIGTTGSIEVTQEHQIVDESNALTPSSRVKGEDLIMGFGGTVVHSAGIYGPNRDPRSWVMRGLVGPEDRYVNFIHIEDLCEILLAATDSKFSGRSFVASDGNPKKWSDLIADWKQKFNLVIPSGHRESKRKSKRIDSSRSLEELGVQLKFKSVNEGLWPIGS